MPLTVAELIGHDDRLDKESLLMLRELVARYPYYQAARLLYLRNLYLLHDESFGDELRKAAVCVTDRSRLFQMVEGHNYDVPKEKPQTVTDADSPADGDRTASLIDRFLNEGGEPEEQRPKRKLTTADATTNYVAFLMDMDDIAPVPDGPTQPATPSPSRSSQLIDGFIESSSDRIVLNDTPQYIPEMSENEAQDGNEEDFFTETLAKIYIKQGRYEKAMEIIRKLDLNYPKKNRYFADQMRFLQKLIINNKHNSK